MSSVGDPTPTAVPGCGTITGVDALLPWQWVRVDGWSMTPTLVPGDVVLARHRAPVRPGAVVLARFRSRRDLVVVKRAVREEHGGWIVASDNERAGTDSRDLGPAEVLGVIGWVWHLGIARAGRPRRPLARFRPHRVASRCDPPM